MKIITVTNQKGGAGKSVFGTNLAFFALRKGLRVLAIDLDPQGSMSQVTFKGHVPHLSATDFVSVPVKPPVLGEGDQLIVVASNGTLRRAAVDPKVLKANLAAFEDLIDVVIIDTAGSINTLAQAAMMCSTHVVCPVEVGAYELDALKPLIENIKTIQQQHNPKLKNLGLLPSKVYTQSSVTRADVEILRNTLGKRVMSFQLSFRSAVQLSVKMKKPVWEVAKDRTTKDEWLNACEAVIS
jgi:chromosome partitioning protein